MSAERETGQVLCRRLGLPVGAVWPLLDEPDPGIRLSLTVMRRTHVAKWQHLLPAHAPVIDEAGRQGSTGATALHFRRRGSREECARYVRPQSRRYSVTDSQRVKKRMALEAALSSFEGWFDLPPLLERLA